MNKADQILLKHEDANEYHFHNVDRKWIMEAMEEYAIEYHRSKAVFDVFLVIDEIKDKHPFEQWSNGAPIYTCPNCKETEIGHGDKNCSNCGQKLEWRYH